MRRAFVIGLVLLAGSGCGSTYGKPPVSDAQIMTFAQDYRARLADDPEFSGLITSIEARRQDTHGPMALVRVDGRQWATLIPSQKDRLLRKASVVLVPACRPYQAAHGSVCVAQFVDDLGTIVGFSLAGGTSPDNYRYQIFQ